ncbi:hypothetical protein HMPREF3152_00625 [Actinomyces sp. HMSC06A08]|uniref:RNA helicase n=2 Tax=Winkia neuii TaxID=33007 RepID=A0A2I1IMG1_9ACTO|nr:ATP-dependent helicase HrpB [Winkia neuii]OFJ68568.1 hypothetical protein HMPREF2851_02030 [Actinomyces sp. HMSC064C12]OFK00557.1 hypothetical protein HMPREF2835_02975 [Actinomyces sp. HMSC072A03]OFT56741.1 hypothetical protein HMPREF3152_00625 [Actinomyces sp. HMSC06A08]KWZ75164.1 ATP-dependent helicase HrpB [Winkia neuii]MDK8099778.1 ATP-dependent helicase HrpB [Winkia neuii]
MLPIEEINRASGNLPAFAVLAPLAEALKECGAAVVSAPPGTGKTTLVPPALAQQVSGRVVVTQPRRLAARAAARRLAQLLGQQVGGEVGLTLRGERKLSRETKVEFVTTGVLLRRAIADPELKGISAVVLDEVHERQIDTDLAVGICRDICELREDFRVVAMSATLDAPRFATALGGVPTVEIDADTYPLQIDYQPSKFPRLNERGTGRDFLKYAGQTAAAALDAGPAQVALLFLPGVRELNLAAGAAKSAFANLDVRTLHGRLTSAEQDEILALPQGEKRLVCTTNIAESSLTVPGVQLVIDSGLERSAAFDVARQMSGLVTKYSSKAASTQRAGRAGRLGPGRVIRLFSKVDWARMQPHSAPEVETADLAGMALLLAAWGAPRARGMHLPSPLPKAALERAEQTLRSLGAIDEAGTITPLGRELAQIPADPRLGRALYEGAPRLGSKNAGSIVATLSSDERSPGADLPALHRQLLRARPARWQADAKRFAALVPASRGAGVENAEGEMVALAYPGRIARRRGNSTNYLLAQGSGAALPAGSPLEGQQWLAVADLSNTGSGPLIRLAAPLSEADARRLGKALTRTQVKVGFHKGRVRAEKITRLGQIELASAPTSATSQEARQAIRAEFAARGAGLFTFSKNGENLRRRLLLLHRALGDPWPDTSLEALGQNEYFTAPLLTEMERGVPLTDLPTTVALQGLLPWPEAAKLDELAPERLTVPSGNSVKLEYDANAGAPPRISVKLQACFGWQQTPTVAGGKVGIQLALLSPAGRPLALTQDLESFWQNVYPQVRAEMRGRYPKHPWPEDPTTARPSLKTKRQLAREQQKGNSS